MSEFRALHTPTAFVQDAHYCKIHPETGFIAIFCNNDHLTYIKPLHYEIILGSKVESHAL